MSRQLRTTFQMSGETERLVEYTLIVGTWRWPAVLQIPKSWKYLGRFLDLILLVLGTTATLSSYPITSGPRNGTPQQHVCAWITGSFSILCPVFQIFMSSCFKSKDCYAVKEPPGWWGTAAICISVSSALNLCRIHFKPCKDTLQCWCVLLTRLETHYLIFYSFLQSSSSGLKHKEKQHNVTQSCVWVLQQRDTSAVSAQWELNPNSVQHLSKQATSSVLLLKLTGQTKNSPKP